MTEAVRGARSGRSVRSWRERAALAAPHLLVVSDLDGTLASITPRPESARPHLAVQRTLATLATQPGCAVAIVTGRSVPDAWSRVEQARPTWLIAEHGAFVRNAEGTLIHADVIPIERSAHLRARAHEIAHVFPGAIVEEKASGVALHYRDLADDKRDALVSTFRLACALQRATVLEGRMVIEGLLGNSDPAAGLRELWTRLPADTWVLAAGDDVFDRTLLEEVARRRNAHTVFVASDERPSPVTAVDSVVDSPEEWFGVLTELVRSLGRHARRN